jgi:hypothetical protein
MELMGTSILGESEIHMPLLVTNHMSDASFGHYDYLPVLI